MGKPKKGRKGNQDDDFGDEVEVDILSQTHEDADSDSEAAKPAAKPAAKKGKKAKKKKDDDWEDDIANELAALSMEANNGVVDDESVNGSVGSLPKKKEKKKNKKKVEDEDDDEEELPIAPSGGKKQIAAFSMLDMMDDDDAGSSSEESEGTPVIIPEKKKKQNAKKQLSLDDDEADLISKVSTAPSTQSAKQGKKSKKKNKKEEDENIDALLAALDKPAEKTDSRKKKKKKKGEEDEDSVATPVDKDGEITTTAAEESKVTDSADVEEKPAADDADDDVEGEDEGSTVKTAAQKKKEKKERQKLQKQQEKLKGKSKKSAETSKPETSESKEPTPEISAATEVPEDEKDEEDEEDGDDKKKKKKKKKDKKEKEEKTAKKPGKSAIAAMKEMLQKQKEEEERLKREEEERIKREEEALRIKEEQERLEREKKERKKQKEKERKERLKAEGKLLTEKQKADRRRALQLLQARGLDVSAAAGEGDDTAPTEVRKKRVVYEKKKKRPTPQTETATTPATPVTPSPAEEVKEVTPEAETPQTPVSEKVEEEVADKWDEEEVKDAWDASDEEDTKEEAAKEKPPVKTTVVIETKQVEEAEEDAEEEEDSEEESEEDSDEDEDEESEETESESEDERTPAEKIRERALSRIQKRREDAEKNRSVDKLRAPVVCVLGHVDTGKTKILDKLRRTNVQDGEAGGITQQIGATNVPDHAILNSTKMCKEFSKNPLKLPGLLIIDTPGHESFSNLRSRGSSLCDIAILVVDIMHGLEPQTIESINLLKQRKTPFIVALNKIDRLYGWRSNPTNDVVNTIKKQAQNTKIEFEDRTRNIITQFAEQSLNAALFYENKNQREYISLVPTSAHTGDGMGNLLALICELSQTLLAKRVSYSEELSATVMEVKAITGLGTTIDVILVNGKIRESDTIILAGTEGPIVTQVRGCLMPQPMKELRVKGQYEHCKEVLAAQGVKIIAKDLEKSLAGLPLYIAHHPDEVEIFKEEIAQALGDVLGAIKLSERGVFVQASTLGSLEALLEFLRTSKIPYAGINIGPVHKRDIMKASVMLEHDTQWAVILAFDVKVEREAQEMADSLGVKIFTAEIIYHLFDSFMAHRAELKRQKQEEFKNIAVFPCKIRVLPQFVFNSRDPIVVGVNIEAGMLRVNTPLCVPSKEFLEVGRVTSIEINHKPTETAKKGDEVCIKIEPVPGDSPKMFGRHFDHTDLLMSKISRQSIDAVKDYFREEMTKADWQLMVELKKIFEIL